LWVGSVLGSGGGESDEIDVAIWANRGVHGELHSGGRCDVHTILNVLKFRLAVDAADPDTDARETEIGKGGWFAIVVP